MTVVFTLTRWIRSGLAGIGVCCLVALLTLTGCQNNESSVAPSVQYRQLERLAVPAVNELFMNFCAHDQSNRATPVDDVANQSSFIRGFMEALRPDSEPTISNTVISVALPDAIRADLSKPTGTYFGTQLSGDFGGRRLADQAINVTLSVVFGTVLTDVGAIPGLASDNLPGPSVAPLNVFPYLAEPI